MHGMFKGPDTVMRLVQQEVGRFYRIGVRELTGSGMSQYITFPRQVAMRLCYECVRYGWLRGSCAMVGSYFGDRDPATVHHAFCKIGDLLATDESFAHDVAGMRQRIGLIQPS